MRSTSSLPALFDKACVPAARLYEGIHADEAEELGAETEHDPEHAGKDRGENDLQPELPRSVEMSGIGWDEAALADGADDERLGAKESHRQR